MTSRFFLVGFMGSGKTTTGKLLAAALGYEFLDLDDWIESQERKTITEIFSENGETGFRALEHQYLRVLGTRENLVLSTGGGTPCHYQNMEWMNAQGSTLFLHTTEEILFDRLTLQKQHRPLIAAMDDTTLKSFIRNKLMERMPYYVQSSIELIDMPSPEVSVKNLIRILS